MSKAFILRTSENLGLNRIVYRSMLPGDTKERIDITPSLDGGYILGTEQVEKSKFINKKS